jgi:L-alanine-DL-glutamate epimerase-like enolase superfamily enzyme
VLVRVDTDAGISGLGEAYWGAGVAELVHRAKPVLIGEDPVNIGRLMDVMIRCMSGEGTQGETAATAISGTEIALWDRRIGRCADIVESWSGWKGTYQQISARVRWG